MSLPFWDYKRVKNEWVHSIVIKKKNWSYTLFARRN